MAAAPRTLVVGTGRAGGSFAAALTAAGWDLDSAHHDDDLTGAVEGFELVLLCVPDARIAGTAAAVPSDVSRVVAHCSGSLGLEVLAPHPRRAGVHPLVALPDAVRGSARLRGAWFALAGSSPPALEAVAAVAAALGGRTVAVEDRHRAAYHAAAAMASNHLVALLGQVDRVAATAGVPLAAYLDLARGALEDVSAVGPAAALTGPVSRGDWETVASHLDALDPAEREAYRSLARAAALLAGREAEAADALGRGPGGGAGGGRGGGAVAGGGGRTGAG